MALAFDAVGPNASGQNALAPTSLTWSHTCGGSNRVLLVGVAVGQASGSDATKTISSVTYAGVAMTSLGVRHSNNQTAGYVQVFGLIAPASGANNVIVTFASAPTSAEAGSLSFNGADQVSGWGTPVLASGATATATATVSSNTSGNIIAYFVVNGADTGTNPTSPATKRYQANFNHSSAGGCSGGATIPATGSSVTCSWPVTADWYAVIAVEVKAAPQAATPSTVAVAAVIPSPPLVGSGDATTTPAAVAVAATIPTPAAFSALFVSGVSGLHFVDQAGAPILPVVDHEWELIGWGGGRNELGVGTTTVHGVFDGYGTIQKANGFNAVLIEAIDSDQGGPHGPNTNGATWDGINPWGAGGIGDLNSTYWARIDDFIQTSAAHGLTVFLGLISSYNLATGTAFAGLNTTNAATFGTAIGNRYKTYPNLVYHFGADYFGTEESEFGALVTALRATGDTHIITCEYMAESETRKDSSGTTTGTFGNSTQVQYDDVYTYNAAYLEVEKSYQQTSPMRPTVYFNGRYDQQTSGYDTVNLDDVLWALTSGAHGVFYGSEATWAWPSTAYGHLTTDTLRTSWFGDMASFWTSNTGWHDLVPDISSTFITSARGTKVTALSPGGGATPYTGGNTYLTGGVTADGKLAVLYTPTSRTITVDGTKLVASYTATWVDPYSFATTAATPSLTSYATPGNNSQGNTRWLLVLKELTGTDATATPTAVQGVAAVPPPTVRLSKTAAVTVVAGAVVVPTPTIQLSKTAVPVIVSTVAAVSAPTVQLSKTATPPTVALVATVPVPSISAGGSANASPTTVVGAATIGTPALSLGGLVTAAAAAGVAAVPVPTISAGEVAAPAGVSCMAAIPSPAVSAGGSATVSPSTVTAAAATQAPQLHAGENVSPAAVALAAAIPTPAVSGEAVAHPASVSAVTFIPVPEVAGTASTTAAPAAVSIAAVIPSPATRTGQVVTATAISRSVVIAGPTVRLSSSVSLSAVVAIATVPSPLVVSSAPVPGTATAASAAVPTALAASMSVPKATGG